MARSMAMLTGSAIENQSSQLGGSVWLDMTAMAKMFCGLEIGDVLHSSCDCSWRRAHARYIPCKRLLCDLGAACEACMSQKQQPRQCGACALVRRGCRPKLVFRHVLGVAAASDHDAAWKSQHAAARTVKTHLGRRTPEIRDSGLGHAKIVN